MTARDRRTDRWDWITADDARWLQRLALRALRAAAVVPAASALSLAACAVDASGEGDGDVREPPAAETSPGEPRTHAPITPAAGTPSACVDGAPLRLAPGLSLAREVDYVADVRNAAVVSERGEACSGASDEGECSAALLAAMAGPQRLITTEGDRVRVWLPELATGLLGEIDTVEEALWLAAGRSYSVECDAKITHDAQGWVIDQAQRFANTGCAVVTTDVKLRIASDGSHEELSAKTDNPPCSVGRRPLGQCELRAVRARSALGAHFARAAQLEAASVPAFAQIEDVLQRHRAPVGLIAAARRARHDEIRHARIVARLARRFGAEPRLPRVQASPIRTLAALAFDNAREGCVLETYGALEASHQAATARDPEVRGALGGIARDELRHAAFSHALDAWLGARLGGRARQELNAARAEAASALRAQLLATPELGSLTTDAGLPARPAALALHARLASALWQG